MKNPDRTQVTTGAINHQKQHGDSTRSTPKTIAPTDRAAALDRAGAERVQQVRERMAAVLARRAAMKRAKVPVEQLPGFWAWLVVTGGDQ